MISFAPCKLQYKYFKVQQIIYNMGDEHYCSRRFWPITTHYYDMAKMGQAYLKPDKFQEMLLMFVAICLIVATPQAENPDGFLSVDCGSNVTSYSDDVTGLTWQNDYGYIRTGSNGRVPTQVNKSFDNYQALQSFRYFPAYRNKHCFVLKLSSNSKKVKVLIRAMFLHGGASELPPPIAFDVYVNATIWCTVQYFSEPDDYLMTPILQEGIFHFSGGVTYVCLLPKQGTPFISSLEVRTLDPATYNLTDGQFLSNLVRWNTGAPASTPTVRYPDDELDRLWLNSEKDSMCKTKSGSSSSIPLNPSSAEVNRVPLKVLSDGWSGTEFTWEFMLSSKTFVSYNVSRCALTSPSIVSNNLRSGYAIFYFALLDDQSAGQNMHIMLNGNDMGSPFNVSGVTVQAFQQIPLPADGVDLLYYSSSGPLLNAIEFFTENLVDPSTTFDDDVNVTSFLKIISNLEDWQGDPCTPVSYDWITCSGPWDYNHVFTKNIVSITLSHVTQSDKLLGLDKISFEELESLTITYSQLNDSIVSYLMNNMTHDYLAIVDLSHNVITGLDWLFQSNVSTSYMSLNLSYNLLTGEVPSLVNLTSMNETEQLNLSGNAFTSLPTTGWGNPSTDGVLNSLIALDLSRNNISNKIGDFDELLSRNILSLQELHISENNITGEFPSELYFNVLGQLTILNLSKNHIGGVLNLSYWEKNMQSTINGSGSFPVNQIFSFLNNEITDISPSLEDLRPTIDFFLKQQDNFSVQTSTQQNTPRFNMSGILLGGNPYCKNASSHPQRYLCRFSVNESIYDMPSYTKRNPKKLLAIVLSLVGGIMLLCSCIFIVTIWNLWRKVRSLQSIQQALADQNVKPPFYSYHDLKLATRDFHKNNILGKGGFGIVYKGVLSDGTAIAVKKLFHSDQQQVLNDFLNEVVLITGIKHKNLAQLTGCCIKERQRILVYEYAEQGNLAEALWGEKAGSMLDWRLRFNLCVNIARGLAYLHEELQPRIIHRDIKAANILLDKNFNPKIADFGLAKSISEEETRAHVISQIAGTRGYIAPEYETGHLTAKADVFSFGILVLEIVSGRKCIDFTLPNDQIYLKTWAEDLQENEKVSEMLQCELKSNSSEIEAIKVINIALICVESNPKLRPTMSQVVRLFLGNVDLTQFLRANIRQECDLDEMFSAKDTSSMYSTDHDIDSDTRVLVGESGESSSLAPSTSSTNMNRLFSVFNRTRFGTSRSIELRSRSMG